MSRRTKAALGLAVAAFVLAAIGAVGPSEHQRSTYSWPPAALPDGDPERLWYAPLLLARHEPAAIAARIPCDPAEPLPGAGAASPALVLATTRAPVNEGGLAVTHDGAGLRISVGGQLLEQLEVPPDGGTDCAFMIRIAGGQWTVEGGSADIADAGSLDAMPRVDGLFSEVDLRSDSAPTVEVTTVVHGSDASIVQAIAWIAAALAAAAALYLVAVPRFPSWPWATAAEGIGRAARQLRPLDAVVVLVLVAWWFLGPAFFDDGWVLARQRNFEESGGFSAYYTSFGTNLPLDYWLEWLQHWIVESTDALLLLRLPALVCLVTLWFLCRYILRRVLTATSEEDRFARWALASAFLAGALAWGMTLRPEPVVALLVAGVLASTIRFLERGTTAPLALASVCVVLALSAHPAGVVSLAPLLVAIPFLYRWARARPNRIAVATIAVAAVALAGTLVTVGSDLGQRRTDVATLRAYGDETAGWRDELNRYTLLSQPPHGAALRRGSVALLLLAVGAYLLRRRREPSDALFDLPASALGVALLLFLATPTKWPWHFGALIGLGAVAVAAETGRLRDEARRSSGPRARPYFAIVAAVAAAGWAWFPRLPWGDLDLRTMDWTLGLESRITLAKLAGAIPILVLAVLALVELRRRRESRAIDQVPWRAAALSAPALAVPLIAFTIGVLLADLSKTDSWTLTRQNLDTLTGDLRCGLADGALVASVSSMRPLSPLTAAGGAAANDAVAASPVDDVPRFTLGPAGAPSAPAVSPWFAAPSGEQIGFFYGGTPSPSDRLELEWGSSAAGGVDAVATGGVPTDFGPDGRSDLAPWRFLPAGSLPARPAGADAVRFVLRSDPVPGGVVALTSPVTYENARLASLLEADGAPTLVVPNLALYFPCAEQPSVTRGVAAPPRLIVGFDQTIWPVTAGTSPFDALPRLYPLVRLPLTDSPSPPRDVAVYLVGRPIPGAVEAPAERQS